MRRHALILFGCAFLFAGCGGGEETTATPVTVEGTQPETGGETTTGAPGATGDPAEGKKIFADQGCGGCHTLEDAGTNGTIGPNLDDAKPSLEVAMDRITNGKPPMPAFKDKLSEQQIADVAAYVVQATSG